VEDEVVEVDRVGCDQLALVLEASLAEGLVDDVVRGKLIDRRAQLFVVVEDGEEELCRKAFVVDVEVCDNALHESALVGIIVDNEVSSKSNEFVIATEEASARGVEGSDPEARCEVLSHELFDA